MDLIQRSGADSPGSDFYFSMIQGRVLPRDSEPETIFRVTEEDGPSAPALVALLRRELLEGRIDIPQLLNERVEFSTEQMPGGGVPLPP